jgi:hypothetical protein
MKAEEILGTPGFRFVEPAFADMTDDIWTDILIAAEGDQGRLLVDEKEDPIAMAVSDGLKWNAGSFHLRKPTVSVIERFEETAGEIWQEDRAVWAEAVREYYSLDIMHSIEPAMEDMNPGRPGMVKELVGSVWGAPEKQGAICLDYCCGSGVGSKILRESGFSPVSFDNDSSLLSLGLSKQRLMPGETMLIDARVASRYVSNARYGLGLMFGDINPFTAELWEEITAEIISLTENTLITLGTEKEARMVEEWVKARGRNVTVFENKRDIIYDRWVCDITRR